MGKSVFLIVNHIMRPREGVKSNKASEAQNPDNWETSESILIAESVSSSKAAAASIILDLISGKVVKNRFEVDDTKVFVEYVERYRQDISVALKIWAAKDPANLAKIKQMYRDAEESRKSP